LNEEEEKLWGFFKGNGTEEEEEEEKLWGFFKGS
jgi:hypothetical protein